MGFLTQLTKRLHFWRIAGLFAADIILFGSTDPKEVPSFMLIVGFLLMAATLYYVLEAMLALLKLYGLPLRNKRLLRIATMLISGLLALQSIGQLGIRDVIILGPLTALAYFYVTYAKVAGRRETAQA